MKGAGDACVGVKACDQQHARALGASGRGSHPPSQHTRRKGEKHGQPADGSCLHRCRLGVSGCGGGGMGCCMIDGHQHPNKTIGKHPTRCPRDVKDFTRHKGTIQHHHEQHGVINTPRSQSPASTMDLSNPTITCATIINIPAMQLRLVVYLSGTCKVVVGDGAASDASQSKVVVRCGIVPRNNAQ